jgi:hypothetical protein
MQGLQLLRLSLPLAQKPLCDNSVKLAGDVASGRVSDRYVLLDLSSAMLVIVDPGHVLWSDFPFSLRNANLIQSNLPCANHDFMVLRLDDSALSVELYCSICVFQYNFIQADLSSRPALTPVFLGLGVYITSSAPDS